MVALKESSPLKCTQGEMNEQPVLLETSNGIAKTGRFYDLQLSMLDRENVSKSVAIFDF